MLPFEFTGLFSLVSVWPDLREKHNAEKDTNANPFRLSAIRKPSPQRDLKNTVH